MSVGASVFVVGFDSDVGESRPGSRPSWDGEIKRVMTQDESASASALLLDVHDTSLSSLMHHNSDDHETETCIDPTLMSDAKYAEELQFQEAIMASSVFSSQAMINTASCSSSTLTIQAIQAIQAVPDWIHIVSCPRLDCKAILTLEECTPILPKLVLERWNEALFEALFMGSQKLYCPFSDDTMVLVIENEDESVRESECPGCHRLFCRV